MKYMLQISALATNGGVAIDRDTFERLKRSAGILSHFFDLTESYRVVVENYKQVERAKHEAELDHLLYSKHEYEDTADVRVLFCFSE
jgi:hypothetical protein